MERIIAINGVGFGYPGQTPILSQVDLEIRQGERILILGPNGSGKSTMALLVAGLLTPTLGEINRYGYQLNIGIVFQNSRHQIVGSTVEEDLAFGLSLKGINTIALKRKVELFLEKFDLVAKRHHNINQLSGGELRRLALASVLIIDPQIIILDEPLAMLDKKNQGIFLDCLRDNLGPEKTLIWFDHEVRSIRYTNRWMVLSSKGQLNQVSLNELNSKAFLADYKLTPAPLQDLEWKLPGRISDSIFGPEGIKFD